MKYNIALIPGRPTYYKTYSQSAQENFGSRYSEYLLGRDSIPHITLCQFDDVGQFDEKKGATHGGLEKITKKLETQFVDHIFHPTFIGLNFLKLASQFGEFSNDLFSVELLVHRETKLVNLHESIVSMVSDFGFQPIGTLGTAYRPHLTLACLNAPPSIVINPFPHNLMGTPHFPFVVKIGLSDNHWQFIKVLSE